MDFRIFSIHERWRVWFTRSLAGVLQLLRVQKFTAVIYDHDLPDAEWRTALAAIENQTGPIFFMLLCRNADIGVWRSVLDSGGYDVVLKPIHGPHLARLLNGALELQVTIDFARVEAPHNARRG